MAEYIEREAALKEFEKVCNVCMALVNKPMCGDCSVADTVRKVKSIPAADVRPVVRGKWIPDFDYEEYDFDGSTPLPEPRGFQDGWQCNLCGGYMPYKTDFCPNCGADMREES